MGSSTLAATTAATAAVTAAAGTLAGLLAIRQQDITDKRVHLGRLHVHLFGEKEKTPKHLFLISNFLAL